MSKIRYFQWIDGEMRGEVTVLKSITTYDGHVYYNFEDDESCDVEYISKKTSNPNDLVNKFIVEVDSPLNIWSFQENEGRTFVDYKTKEVIDIPSLSDITGSKQKPILVPPKNRQKLEPLPNISDYCEEKEVFVKNEEEKKKSTLSSHIENEKIEEEKKEKPLDDIVTENNSEKSSFDSNSYNSENIGSDWEKSDAVYCIFKKCKKHQTDINLTITVDLPSSSTYSVIKDEFGDEDGFLDYIVSNIDTEMLFNRLKYSLKDAYNSKLSEN